jgi:hypothetical protein
VAGRLKSDALFFITTGPNSAPTRPFLTENHGTKF